MGVKLPVKAEKRTKTKNATSSQKLPLSVVRCIAAVAFLILWQRLCDPLPPKSCRIWSCEAHADEAFLVLWASTNNQWG
ncbi:hypothetical protein ABE66_02560 [Cytobacillus firmus]|nr:hypothetical protein [Cytobacillus firmus]